MKFLYMLISEYVKKLQITLGGKMRIFKIKEKRKHLNLTIKQLSIKSGVAIGYLSTLENDIRGGSNPSREIMIKIAHALESTAHEVFF